MPKITIICRLHVTIVDFMSQINKMLFSKICAFSDAFNARWNSVQSISQFQQLHIIFDTYLQHSAKDVVAPSCSGYHYLIQ